MGEALQGEVLQGGCCRVGHCRVGHCRWRHSMGRLTPRCNPNHLLHFEVNVDNAITLVDTYLNLRLKNRQINLLLGT